MEKTMKKILCTLLIVVMCLTSAPIGGFDLTAEATEYQVGDIIEFGSYPQSEVTDSLTVSALNNLAPSWENWRSYGYYSGKCKDLLYPEDYFGTMAQGDWMRYTDVDYNGSKYRGVKFTKYRPGATVMESSASYSYQDDNGYSLNSIYWFKFEPIEWQILDPESGFVVSKKAIDSQAFCNTIYRRSAENYYNSSSKYANDYETSSIRKWLNDDFYYTAFSDNEKDLINETTISNKGYYTLNGQSGYEKFDSKNTTDKIFLLSYEDVTNPEYLFDSDANASDSSRMATGTDYAKCQGLQVHKGDSFAGNSYLLLRNPGDTSRSFCYVHVYCNVACHVHSYSVDRGVRPAMCVDLDVYDMQINGKFLDGYNPLYDEYPFKNTYAPNGAADYIDRKYYTSVLGGIIGNIAYLTNESGTEQHGVCFGMAATTAAFLKDKSKLEDYYLDWGLGYSQINTLSSIQNPFSTYSVTKMLSIEDYIKYAHIYQHSPSVALQRSSGMNNIELLYETVKDRVDSNKQPVIIDFASKYLKEMIHSVLAVGYKETKEHYIIYIDNPNDVGIDELKISKDDKSWSGAGYSSESNSITFNTADVSNLEQPSPEIATTYQALLIKSAVAISADKVFVPVSSSNSNETTENQYNLYWTKEETEQIIITPEEDGVVTVACYSSAITVDGKKDGDICFYIGENTADRVSYKTEVLDETKVSYMILNDKNNIIEIEIKGISSDTEVTISQTETGLEVTGISDGTITLTKDDEVIATKTITDAESDIEIAYDKNGGSDTLEVEYEAHEHEYNSVVTKEVACTQPGVITYTCTCGDTYTETIPASGHTFTEGESKCSDCDYDKADDCSCNCHASGIKKFFFNFILFFQKLFGKNQICSCGAAHY